MKTQVASAGTGKTTQLVLGVLERIGEGTPLRRIACVTFTTTAAEQLRERIRMALGDVLRHGSYLEDAYTAPAGSGVAFASAVRELDGIAATTIHGFMGRCLRLTAPTLGLRADLSVIGEWEARALFEEAVDSLRLLARNPDHDLHDAFERLAVDARPRLLDLFGMRSLTLEIEPDEDPRSRDLVTTFGAAMRRYRDRLGPGLLAPAEVERLAVRLAETPGARDRVVRRYPVVLVDEFQDVNPVQGAFFERLEAAGAEVEVVGDPKQSIYGFRHADIEVFRRALRQGERRPALTETRRHAVVLARFLNALTAALSARGLGFDSDEAPQVETAGERTDVRGRVEVHWVTGERPIGELREQEARVLAQRLVALHQGGWAYRDMAVLARSYASLDVVEGALGEAGIPYVFLQGRGFYERQEIRDLVHALRVGIEPQGASLAAWLRSPYAQLEIGDVERVMGADDPVATLRADYPEVAQRLETISTWTLRAPLDALAAAIREPIVDGRTYASFLDPRARENVDALLFTIAERPPRDLAALLELLALLSRQTDAGDVPQAGEGVQLLTVHRSKGLEWPVVAVFDVGRMTYRGDSELYLHPDTGVVSLPGSPGFAGAQAAHADREIQETYRLFYVAASRPRDVLVLTGSVKAGPRGAPEGWAIALASMGLGPGAGTWERDDFILQTHDPDAVAPPAATSGPPQTALEPAPWIDRAFHAAGAPVRSPSRFHTHDLDAGGAAPVAADSVAAAPESSLPGRGAAIGTLVHWSISRDLDPAPAQALDVLRAQEVMFPFDAEEREEILVDVRSLVAGYRRMLGQELPSLGCRADGRAEVPFAFRRGPTVWQGVIDRLYRVADTWYVDDYKTDRTVAPERYHLQAAVYRQAVVEALGTVPVVRLAYLRTGTVVELDDGVLLAALERSPDGE